jgi:type VI secretion system protein ImpK
MSLENTFETDNSLSSQQTLRVPLERLATLYESIFTVIGRIQSGKQPIQEIDTFQTRMKSAINEIARAAAQRGYNADAIAQANFAVVAFLDEAVLTSSESGRTQWARKTLQEEMFGQRSAGEVFFQRLDQLRPNRDSSELIQLLEVFYLCLLLGYEGKFSVGSKGELYLLMDNLRDRIERTTGRSIALSPNRKLDKAMPTGQQVATADPLPRWTRLAALGAALLALICFIVFKLILSSQASEISHLFSQVSRSG